MEQEKTVSCNEGKHNWRDIWLWSRKLDDYDYFGSQCRACGEMKNERGAGRREFNIEWRGDGQT